MRWVCVLILLATASTASARMIRRRDPPVVEACRARKDWAAVTACLDKLGTFTLDHTAGRGRLVHVWLDGDRKDVFRLDAGFYLYVQAADGVWRIGGVYSRASEGHYVRDLAEITIAGHVVYRIDVGTFSRTALEPDDGPRTVVAIRTRGSLFCYGTDFGSCTELQTDCEVLDRGKALFAFHGTLQAAGRDLRVAGDDRNAGPTCLSMRSLRLAWPGDPQE